MPESTIHPKLLCGHPPLVWSPYSRGGRARCWTCEPPAAGETPRQIGILSNGQILNARTIRNQIAESNRMGVVIGILETLGPGQVTVLKRTHENVAPAPRRRRLAPIAPSEPPPPELAMTKDSPFWVDRSVEKRAIEEYNKRVAPSAAKIAPTQGDPIPEGSRRIRRTKPR